MFRRIGIALGATLAGAALTLGAATTASAATPSAAPVAAPASAASPFYVAGRFVNLESCQAAGHKGLAIWGPLWWCSLNGNTYELWVH
ncbi:hypothetical protein [Streptomyces sp. NPDC020965]|uniref:hypothetical protein n=1 Tax=Streptomyces sp. NPDC020965 TaxID=3365105 RepID=UPI0037A8FC49